MFPFIWYSFTYKSLNYNEILTELNSAILNICHNLVGNIMQVEPIFPKVEKNPKPVSFLHLEGMQSGKQSKEWVKGMLT